MSRIFESEATAVFGGRWTKLPNGKALQLYNPESSIRRTEWTELSACNMGMRNSYNKLSDSLKGGKLLDALNDD